MVQIKRIQETRVYVSHEAKDEKYYKEMMERSGYFGVLMPPAGLLNKPKTPK